MTAYYNENDAEKAEWLRELMRKEVIAYGWVDERSITEVGADDLREFNQCHFFAGIGVWSYALRLAGWPDDRPVWTGSCPCPSFSCAGKGSGFDDPRHLWPAWSRLIRECKPATIFGEQADDAIGYGWLDLVQTDLERAAYSVGKAVLGACSVGAPHIRQRLYFCAYHLEAGREQFKAPRVYETRPSRDDADRCGGVESRSESLHAERWPLLLDREDGRNGSNGGRSEAHSESGTRSEILPGISSDPEHSGHDRSGGTEAIAHCDKPQERIFDRNRATSEHGDSGGQGLPNGQPQELRGPRRWEEGRTVTEPSEAFSDGGDSGIGGQPMRWLSPGIARHAALADATRGFWRNCDWWYGRDGKYRPIEPGLFPLVAGASNRVLKLRGFGDAIVAPLAAEFIQASEEARQLIS